MLQWQKRTAFFSGSCVVICMAKILVADDEQLIRQLVCDFLENAGHETLAAADGAAALKLFRENPDTALLILDIMFSIYRRSVWIFFSKFALKMLKLSHFSGAELYKLCI